MTSKAPQCDTLKKYMDENTRLRALVAEYQERLQNAELMVASRVAAMDRKIEQLRDRLTVATTLTADIDSLIDNKKG